MGRKRKPFIDKKHATTYKLVHRSQHDPLIADDEANQLVLKQVPGAGDQAEETRLKAQQECGIFCDDDYDYLQHVRNRSDQPDVVWEAQNPTRAGKVELPLCVLPSAQEEPVGMLNLAAPRGLDLSLDPDIVAALDDDFDFEDPELELEDDFITMAEEGGSDTDSVCSDDSERTLSSGAGYSDVPSLCSGMGGADTCRFTEYSVSSSVLPRNEGLSLLDDKFEEMYKEYDALGAGEDEMKAVDELGAPADPSLILEHLCEEFERNNLSDEESMEEHKTRTLALAADQAARPERTQHVELDRSEAPTAAADKWDCETILSTYTNIYNHPKLIDIPKQIKLNRKGLVVEEEGDEGVCVDEESCSDQGSGKDEEENTIVISNLRDKSETAEEKRARKKAVKESQKTRRQIKKATKEVFKEEDIREKKMNVNKPAGRVIKL